MRRHPERLASHRREVGFGLLARVRLAARHHDVGAGCDEALGDGPADAAGAAGDDRDAAGELVQLRELVLVHRGAS